MRAPVVLHAISSFDDTALDYTALAIINGFKNCVTSAEPLRKEITNSPDFWSVMHRLHQHKDEAEHVFELLQAIVTNDTVTVTADNYEATIGLANDFASAGSVGTVQEQRRDLAARRGQKAKPAAAAERDMVSRGVTAIGIIVTLTARIPDLISKSHLERNEAWAAYWSPIFRALSAQCLNPCREIRHKAVSGLQRSLLSDKLASDDHTEWVAIFGEVLFPLVLRLLKPEVYKLDPAGMSETRVQAATLLCKIFLRYMDDLAKAGQMMDVWLKILEVLDRMMNSGQQAAGGGLEEAIPESLKNILLVMSGAGYLQPPSDRLSEDDKKLWVETKKRLNNFLPKLFEDVLPPQPMEGKKQENVAPEGSSSKVAGEGAVQAKG